MISFVVHIWRDRIARSQEEFAFKLIGMHILLQIRTTELSIPVIGNMP